MNSTVKLTHNGTIQPYDTVQSFRVTNAPNHSQHINVITEPLHSLDQGQGIYTVPGDEFLRVGSNRVLVALRNLSCRKVILKKGTVITHVRTANQAPSMLAPKSTLVMNSTAYPNSSTEPMHLSEQEVHTHNIDIKGTKDVPAESSNRKPLDSRMVKEAFPKAGFVWHRGYLLTSMKKYTNTLKI